MKDKWTKFDEKLPTNVRGEQEEESLRDRLAEYKPDLDQFWAWESMMPTHWIKLPEKPKE